ncbi:nucleoside deaminase [Bacteroidales bacterium OttesenSCG-928-E04]|nr:nucleoside deaminase [Bacteroidales bacterium OttesenSCG-928-E04]
MYDEKFMKEALVLARQCFETGRGGPFGAVVVKDGEIIGRGANSVTTNNDPTAHAEVLAIREACENLNTFQLNDCEIYSSCEPCPMCLGAIYWARPKALYFAAGREDAANGGFDDSFIYDEINQKTEERKIPTFWKPSETAVEIFEEWKRFEGKVEY